jgi:hypothetical protein
MRKDRFMKNLKRVISYTLAVFLVAGITTQVIAGDKKITKRDVPAEVLKAFEAAFPKVEVNAYLTESEDSTTFYEFETVEGTIKRDILYKADGTLVEVEEILTPETVPIEIAKAVTTNMHKAQILGGEKTTKGSEITYEIKIKAGKKTGKVVLSADGKIIKKEMKKAKKEKKEENEEEEKEEKDTK